MENQTKFSLSEVVKFALTEACPCNFPRILYLLTFDPEDVGLPPMEIECSQALINQFAFTIHEGETALRTVKDLGAGKKSLKCSKCGSEYQCEVAKHGKDLNYTVMTIRENRGQQIGAGIQLPMPIPGRMIAATELTASQQAILFKTFTSANQNPRLFVEYMTALKS